MRSSLVVLALVAGLSLSCRDQELTPQTPKDDAGTSATTCNTTADCGGRGVCVSGLCESVTTCTTDDECSAQGKICHTIRGYCVQCDGRHQGECPEGQTCQFDFTCVAIGGPDAGMNTTCSGTCTDRSMCATDQVCKMGSCCPPPSRCISPNDCPADRPECNGATGQCFGSSGCNTDTDCNSQPGCANNACECDDSQGLPGSCRPKQNECASDADCLDNGVYVGEFCTLGVTPTSCQLAPGCTSNADCAPYNLVCDLMAGSPSNGKCVNGTPCPNGNECGANEFCDPSARVCIPQNCVNTPSLCTANETCNPSTGQCTPAMSGTCTSDTDCPSDRYCDTLSSTCRVGCRTNADCASGVCDASHQCQAPSGGVCGPCTTDADCPANTQCVEALGLCYEQCSSVLMMPCTVNPMAQCVFGNCSCLL